jgi:hypothetical protein
MKKLIVSFVLMALIFGTVIAISKRPEIETIVFIDYESPQTPPEWGPYGPACPVGDDSDVVDDYRLTIGGIRWYGFPVNYNITNSPSGVSFDDTKDEVESAFETWDSVNGNVAVGNFFEYDATATNTVSWSSIDGSGGIIATASVSYYPHNKTIVSFRIVFDSGDPWGINKSEKFDIQNIAAHEVGHVVGLDDLSSPKDCWLTMYRYGRKGETSKRDLGLGDVLGMQELY